MLPPTNPKDVSKSHVPIFLVSWPKRAKQCCRTAFFKTAKWQSFLAQSSDLGTTIANKLSYAILHCGDFEGRLHLTPQQTCNQGILATQGAELSLYGMLKRNPTDATVTHPVTPKSQPICQPGNCKPTDMCLVHVLLVVIAAGCLTTLPCKSVHTLVTKLE